MIKPLVVGFGSIGGYPTLDGRCGILEHLYSYREVKCLQGYLKTLWMWV